MKHLGVFLMLVFVSGCAAQKQWAATGGSRADGTVRLSYEVTEFESAQVDELQGTNLASRRCQTWGYGGAEAFGGTTRQCNDTGGMFGGCAQWLVTKEFQCTGTGSGIPPEPARAPVVIAPSAPQSTSTFAPAAVPPPVQDSMAALLSDYTNGRITLDEYRRRRDVLERGE